MRPLNNVSPPPPSAGGERGRGVLPPALCMFFDCSSKLFIGKLIILLIILCSQSHQPRFNLLIKDDVHHLEVQKSVSSADTRNFYVFKQLVVTALLPCLIHALAFSLRLWQGRSDG